MEKKMFKFYKLITVLFLSILFVFTFKFVVTAKDTIKIGVAFEPDRMDPQLSQGGGGWTPNMIIWNRLVEYDNTMMDPIPSVAESWENSDGGKLWTFKIRKGLKFHSGRELTAADVEYSFKRGFEIGPKGRFAGYMIAVDTYKAKSPYVFEVRLKQVDVTFLANLAVGSASIVDKETIDEIQIKPIGSGPYEFVEWVPGEKIVYKKNMNYWNKLLLKDLPNEIETTPIKEAQTRIANLQSGQVDMISVVPIEFWQQIKNNPNLKLLGQETTASYKTVIFNLQKPPFQGNKLLRQAIAHAINKEAIHQTVFFGSGEVGCNLIPKNHGHIQT